MNASYCNIQILEADLYLLTNGMFTTVAQQPRISIENIQRKCRVDKVTPPPLYPKDTHTHTLPPLASVEVTFY